jgi:hypothetical protein
MSLSKEDQIAYWSSEKFLNKYFQRLEFDEPYSKATGTIALMYVKGTWQRRMKFIVFELTRNHIEAYNKLPEGQYSILLNWRNRDAHWLIKCLRAKQIITFPKIRGGYLE